MLNIIFFTKNHSLRSILKDCYLKPANCITVMLDNGMSIAFALVTFASYEIAKECVTVIPQGQYVTLFYHGMLAGGITINDTRAVDLRDA